MGKWWWLPVMLVTEHDCEQFWDHFAETYAEIEQESQVPITNDVKNYLIEKRIFPTNKFVDLASGTGRYIASFLPYVQKYLAIDFSSEMLRLAHNRYEDSKLVFRKLSQAEFIAKEIRADVLFTAMNPALTTKEDLFSLIGSSKKMVILRVIHEEEDLFQLYEEPASVLPYMTWYKKWLKEINQSFYTQRFSYCIKEEISKTFFKSYFETEYNYETLKGMIKRHFTDGSSVISTTVITYELMIILND